MHPDRSSTPEPKVAQGERLRILIVEDDFLIGMLLADMLEMMGHEVCATEATEAGAVTAAAKWLPTMLIVDAQLRQGSGIAAVDTILHERVIPYVFVTGDIRGVRKLRPDAIIVEKPFTEVTLISAMQLANNKV